MITNIAAYAICRVSVAFVWLYQGLVPKLLGPHKDEIAMNMALGLSEQSAIRMAAFGGAVELAFGLAILVLWRHCWPLLITAFSMVGLLIFAFIAQPDLAAAAFNPVTTNVCVFALAVVGFKLQKATGHNGS